MTAWPSRCVIRSGLPASVADLPWSWKLFCPSMFHIKATVLPVCFSLVQQRGVVQPPLGLVELGRGSGPVLVAGLEPDGPFARVLAGQQPRQPGGPDVGVFAALGHLRIRSVQRRRGLPTAAKTSGAAVVLAWVGELGSDAHQETESVANCTLM